MGFGEKQAPVRISGDRLAALGGNGGMATIAAAGGTSAPRRRGSVEPDVSRIRKSRIEETPAERKKRLAAKTVNFGATILARLVIIGAAGLFVYDLYQTTGALHRGVAVGLFVMVGDLGRVLLKAMEPGSK